MIFFTKSAKVLTAVDTVKWNDLALKEEVNAWLIFSNWTIPKELSVNFLEYYQSKSSSFTRIPVGWQLETWMWILICLKGEHKVFSK